MIYLDYNATAPTHPAAIAAMQPWITGGYNASSVHQMGRKARMAIEAARAVVAAAVAADRDNVIFTASGSEANNHIIATTKADAVVVSAIEHASILAPAKARALRDGLPYQEVMPNHHGMIEPEALREVLLQLKAKRPLVCVMLANNETGVIQPVAKLVDVARGFGAWVHCDAVQSLGKMPLDITDLGVNSLAISAHKMGGVVGAAALIWGQCMPSEPFILGGGQEKNRRAGTENLPAIAAFAAAIEATDRTGWQPLEAWRNAMEAAIMHAAPEAVIVGEDAPRLPNTSCIIMPAVESQVQLMAFDLAGVAVSSGSACTSGKVAASHVLQAMGLCGAKIECTIRISGGWASVEADFTKAAKLWIEQYKRSSQVGKKVVS